MLSFLYVYSDHSILECYNLFSGVELSMRSFFVIQVRIMGNFGLNGDFPRINNTEGATCFVCKQGGGNC